MTTDLDLVIHAAETLDVAIREIAGHVARTVQKEAGFAGERIADKPFGSQLRALVIPGRNSIPSDEKLTRHSDGHQVKEPIEDVELGIGDWAPDGHRTSPLLDDGGAGPDGSLRRTVHVEDVTGHDFEKLVRQRVRQGFSAEQ
jgi:hypothetical protein